MTAMRIDAFPNGLESAALLRLLTWLSPAFPVGAFAYSHGLEQAIRDGAVKDVASLTAWISALVTHGSGWTDAVLFKAAWSADEAALAELAELAEALAPSLERRRETMAQGEAFQKAVRPWFDPSPPAGEGGPRRGSDEGLNGISAYVQQTPAASPLDPSSDPAPQGHLLPQGEKGPIALPYPVAVGAAAGRLAIPAEAALTAWLHAFCANLVSAAVRAVPLGQTQGVATLAALEPHILAAAARAAQSTLDDLGSASILSDIAAMRHETLEPRLFIS